MVHPSITTTKVVGSIRSPLGYAPYQKYRNQECIINGRNYSGHALDRMQDTGLMPSVVENAIQHGQKLSRVGKPGNAYYDPINNIRVITNDLGKVVTTYPRGG